MDLEGDVLFRPRSGKAAAAPLIPEVEAYLQLLLLVHLINNKRYTEVHITHYTTRNVCVCNHDDVFQAQKVSDNLLQKISAQNRRALDLVAAKCYYYHCRVYEFLNQLDAVRRYQDVYVHHYTHTLPNTRKKVKRYTLHHTNHGYTNLTS